MAKKSKQLRAALEKIDSTKAYSVEEAVALANEKHVPVEKHYTEVGQIINAFFEEFVEETLTQPTFVYGQ